MGEEPSAKQIAQGSFIAQADRGGTAVVNVKYVASHQVDPEALAVAERQLAALPLDTIPAPAPLPSGSRMPFAWNPLFVGREGDLKVLARLLKVRETAAIGQIVAVTGLGGIGKTQLVSEFVHRYGQYFAGGVFWLNFTDPASIKAQVAECGLVSNLNLRPDFSELDIETQAKLVRAVWQEPIPRLLVFDNCEEEAPLADLRPSTGGGRVLITSRREMWSQTLGVTTLPLSDLSRAESITLLHKFRPDLAEDDSDLDAIAKKLSNLPLALHLVGSFLKHYQYAVTPSSYLAQLQDKSLLDHLSLQGQGSDFSPTEHELHVAKTFALSYDRLDPDDETDKLALALLARAAYFAPGEPIPRKLLQCTTLSANETWAQTSELITAWKNIGNEIFDLQAPAENVHALLVELKKHIDHRLSESLAVYTSLAEGNTEAIAQLAISPDQLVDQLIASLEETIRLKADLGELQTSQKELQTRKEELQTRQEELHTRTKTYLVKAQQILDQVKGDAEIDLQLEDALIRLNNLGLLKTEIEGAVYLHPLLTTFVRARAFDETAQAAVEEILLIKANLLCNADLPTSLLPLLSHLRFVINSAEARRDEQVAGLYHVFGGYLDMLGDYSGAKLYFEQALAIYLESLGEMHFKTAGVYNSLGLLLHVQEDLDGAQIYVQKALTISEAVRGRNSSITATFLHNVGMLLSERGELTKARPCIEQALEIRLEKFGEIHRDTAHSFMGLGLLLMRQGNLEEARVYLEKALTIRLEVLGENHPDVALSFNLLTNLRLAQGDEDIVWMMKKSKQAVAISEAQYGPDHPTTRLLQNNIDIFHDALVNEIERRLVEGSPEEIERIRQIILEVTEQQSAGGTAEEQVST